MYYYSEEPGCGIYETNDEEGEYFPERWQAWYTDDSLWDFSSHIVGLGEVMYNYVIDHPNCIIELQKDYVENFEYGFDKAIYEIENSKYD